MKNFRLNKLSEYVILELAACAAVLIYAFFISSHQVQNRIESAYSKSAGLASEIAAASAGSLSRFYPDTINTILSDKFNDLIKKNEDIAYIEYKDTAGNIIYSSKRLVPFNEEDVCLSVSPPVFEGNKLQGFISMGMTGKTVSSGRNRQLAVMFFAIFGFISLILLLNVFLFLKELKKIYRGVKLSSSVRLKNHSLERNRLRAVLMSIINGVIVCDIYDSVIMANSAALKMLDTIENKFLNTKIQDYTDADGVKCFEEKIEEFKNTPLNIKEQKPLEFSITAGVKTIKAVISPMFLKQKDYAGYVIVLIDITREEEVNRLKNTFISNVSHELRTPVTVLRTYIDTLCNNAEDFDEDTKKEFMKTIDNEAKRLHSMVNEILDFSRLESGNVKLRKEYADLAEILKQNISSIQILADEKNIKINFKQEAEIPKVPINIESIDRAVRNLLSNAVKYSPDGKDIEVTLGCGEDKQYAVFAVKDNGIGIPKEHLDKIFDRFYRVENAAHTIKGTGLGLHLVKITVEKHHNGKITVRSRENEGSVFTVYLPFSADEDDLA